MSIFSEALREGFGFLASGSLDIWAIIITSLRVSGSAVALALTLGVPTGFLLGTRRSVSRSVALAIANAGMGLPPVVVGLVVAMTLSRRGPLGNLSLMYTQTAMVIAQVIIAAPVVAAVTAAAVSGVPHELRLQLRSLGASRVREAAAMLVEARMGLFAAIAAGFGSIISEVGAVTMVGGNIAGDTRVMTTAIVEFTRKGNYGEALALAIILMSIVIVVNVLLTTAQTSAERWDPGR